MKNLISGEQMYEAYQKANLGATESYGAWTPLWALRSKIWRSKRDRKVAQDALGTMALEAIDQGEVGDLQHLAAALAEMLKSERSPEYAVLADVYFALEQLNGLSEVFTKADLLWWLNKKLEAVLTAPEVEGALVEMGLSDAVPEGERTIR